MCGLGGLARLGRGARLDLGDPLVLDRMLATLAHRGPDQTNVEINGRVGLAFTRLALVGLDGGQQPFTNAAERVSLMANGEVYNHRELEDQLGYTPRTGSDCEVLVPAYERWGRAFLSHVRGILAVAIHDERNNRLILAVDPFANKPMFFASAGDVVVFASEIKALFDHPAIPREIDWEQSLLDQGLPNYVAFSHEPVNTWFRGVHKVAAGTTVEIDLDTGAFDVAPYWAPEITDHGAPHDQREVPEYISEYRRLLWRSIEDSLMADVDLGLFLSGGVDSAAIAAIAATLGQRLETFTVATEATVLNGDVSAAAAVAREIDSPHTLAMMTAGDVPSPQDWRRLLWLMESPLAGPEHLYKFALHRVAKRRRPDLKAMLLGTGADEFNGGYSDLIGRGQGWHTFIRNLTSLSVSNQSPGRRWWADDPQSRLLSAHAEIAPDPNVYRDYVLWKYRDVQQYNCWLEDRAAAGNGIEARVPFLDFALVDFALAVPSHLRPQLLWDKQMARLAVQDVLPRAVVVREKKPFFDGRTARFSHGTIRALLSSEDYELVEEALSGPRMRDYISGDAVLESVRADGRAGVHAEFLLRLVNLGLLDILAASVPEPFHADQIALRATECDLDDVRAALAPYAVSEDARLRLADGARLVHDVGDTSTWFLMNGNDVEYVIDADENSTWVAMLRAFDGSATLAEVATVTGVPWTRHREFIDLCLEQGLLVAVTPQAAPHMVVVG